MADIPFDSNRQKLSQSGGSVLAQKRLRDLSNGYFADEIALAPGSAAVSAIEDVPALTGDPGTPALFVRTPASPVAQTNADGDYGFPAMDSFGDVKTLTVDSTGAPITYNALGPQVTANSVAVNIASDPTYSAALNVTVAAAATDIAVISGSASKTVKVNKVIITGVQTTGGLNDIQLVKRSTADTGGTSTAATAVPHDSADAAATASVLAYTVNPAALGTSVGNIRRGYLPVGGATSIVNPVVVFDFGAKGKEIYLRGIAQQLAVNLNGATLTGGAFDIDFEWTEI